MEYINLLSEIKHLHTCIGKKLFEMHGECNITAHPSPLQMSIINVLQENEDNIIFPKDIQKEMKVSKAAISDAIDKMEKKGYIQKVPWEKDGRKTQIILLEKGKETYFELKKNLDIINTEMMKGLSKVEIDNFLKTIHKIESNIEEREKDD